MAKKSKEKTMDLFYLDMDEKEKKKGKKKKNKNKELEKKTKDNVIDFDNEIIIGVTEIPDNKPKSKENKRGEKLLAAMFVLVGLFDCRDRRACRVRKRRLCRCPDRFSYARSIDVR